LRDKTVRTLGISNPEYRDIVYCKQRVEEQNSFSIRVALNWYQSSATASRTKPHETNYIALVGR
jgi:hypothetical protein